MKSLLCCRWGGKNTRDQGQFCNFEYLWHIIIVWFGKMDMSGKSWVHVYIKVCSPTLCASDYYTAIGSAPCPLPPSLSLSLPLPSIYPICSLSARQWTKHTVMHREREARETHTTITYGYILTISSTLHYLQLTLAKMFLLCFPTLCIICPRLHLHICPAQFVSLLWYPIRTPHLLLHPVAMAYLLFF